jgi:excisionase family DNA binding protein
MNEKGSPATSLIARRYFRVEEVARYFAVSDRTVYRLIDMGDLQAVRLRGCTRVPAEEIHKLEERLRVVL